MATTTTTSVHDLIERVQRYNPGAQVDLIRKAYDFSARAHEGQVRRSGEPYLQHPLAVAEVLATLKLDVPAIVAGLLHDTVEDTVCTQEQIEAAFGKDVARLVGGEEFSTLAIGPFAADQSHITSTDWSGYPVLRFPAAPESVEVHIIPRPGQPFLGICLGTLRQ